MKFDGNKKLIVMEDGEKYIDVRLMYQKWKQWSSDQENIVYPLALKYVGGDELEDDNHRLGITYFLINGWKIKPYEANHTLTIEGNLYSDDKLPPVIKTDGSYNVLVVSKVSNLIDMIKTSASTIINKQITNNGNVDNSSSDDEDWQLNN